LWLLGKTELDYLLKIIAHEHVLLGELLERPHGQQHPLVRKLARALRADSSERVFHFGETWEQSVCAWRDGTLFAADPDCCSRDAQGVISELLQFFPFIQWGHVDRWDVSRPVVAITGTRSPTEAAEELAWQLGELCAEEGWGVIHGAARGIDTAAGEGFLERQAHLGEALGGRNLAVLGEGLLHAAENHARPELFHNRAALSFEHPRARPSAATLLARNRAIAWLGDLLVVGEVKGGRGGAWQTFQHARSFRRPVFLFPRAKMYPARSTEVSSLHAAGYDLLRSAAANELSISWKPDLIKQVKSSVDGDHHQLLDKAEEDDIQDDLFI
jgi:predicted Rossmann fold nucleotide-binding protein DprA/Smf involved in DNA uptake